MKRILLFLSLILGLYSTTINSECLGCRDLQKELNNANTHIKNLSAEMRALTKDLLSIAKDNLKLMGVSR